MSQHPHRGFETVTIVYQGEVSHRDSTSKGGTIGPGDVQWMTVGSRILHDEFHSEHFSKTGGVLEMVQLWVNLPAKDKMTTAGYQAILNKDIPVIPLEDNAGTLRVIAGSYPANTFSPLSVWDMRLNKDVTTHIPLTEGWNTMLIILHGTVLVNNKEIAREGQTVVFDQSGSEISVETNTDVIVLFLAGESINKPVVGHGPFVMNSVQEIHQAIDDFNSGKFGQMAE